MLTVKQLIEELSKYPSDMPVMVDGYEGGYNAVVPEKIYLAEVHYHPREAYYGDYQIAQPGRPVESQQVLILSRKGEGEHY
jgi:hypothetical protein